MLVVVLILYFLIILILYFFKLPAIENPTLNLFKSMFPSWKFFDESSNTPILLYRTKEKDSFTEWKICLMPPERKWFHFILNPEGNYYLNYHSHIQQFLGDLAVFDENQSMPFYQQLSYQITENFVRFELLKKRIKNEFQFKISQVELNEDKTFKILEDIIISPINKMNSEIIE